MSHAERVSIREVRTSDDIDRVAALAREIWREYYPPIIGSDQVEYMLDTFQSPTAISRQMHDRHAEYFLVDNDGEPVGYFAVEPDDDVLFLSKIYIRSTARRHGCARRCIGYVRGIAARRMYRALRLTVNRHNVAAISAYRRLGFLQTGKQVTDIGHGHVMDDFVYELIV